jgi:hypothetical protein
MKKLWLGVTGAVLTAVVGSLWALQPEDQKSGQAKAEGAGGGFKPVAPLLVVMENVDDLFGEFPKKMKDKEKLKGLKKDALFLSELFNVVGYHHPEKDWRDWAQKNLSQLQKFASECEKGDAQALKATYDAISATCDACHDKYRDKDK